MNKTDRTSLKHTTASGAAVSMSAQVAKFTIQLAYQVALSRMLSPSEFGVVAMVAPVVAFVQLLSDFGLSQATVQRREISQGQLSLLFWANVVVCALLCVATVACAPLVGKFYGDSRVTMVTASLGTIFLLSGLSSQPAALMTRRMRFRRLSFIDVASTIGGAVLGLAAANTGFSYWAIVIAQATSSFITLVLSWILCGWRVSLPDWHDWRGLLGFGANLTGFNVANYFARNLDNALIGKFRGGYELGLYDRAYKLMLLPLSQISQPLGRVALPLLSRTLDQPDLYRKAYLRSLELILIITYPGVLFAVITHNQLIRLVLGEKWMGVAPVFAILGIGALFAPIGNSSGWLFISQNRTRQMLHSGLVSSALFVTAFVAGLPWGPVGVAGCYIGVGIFIQGPFVIWSATRYGPVHWKHLLRSLCPHFLSILCCCAIVVPMQNALPHGFLSLGFLFVAAYLSYFTTMLLLPHGKTLLKEGKDYIRSLRRRTPCRSQ